jgi:hypothetical protein
MDYPDDELLLSDKELRSLISMSLPNGSVNRMASTLLDNREELSNQSGTEFVEILDGNLNGHRARLLAAESLLFARLDAKQAAKAESILCKIVSKRDMPVLYFFTRLANVFVRYWILGPILSLIMYLIKLTGSDVAFISTIILSVCCFIGLPFVSFGYDVGRHFTLRRKCAAALGRWGGPASIGVLLSAIEEGAHWDSARPALRDVIVRLSQDDYAHVSAHTIGRLNALLLKPFPREELDEWVPLIIDSLEKIGNGSSVEAVERIATKGRNPQWREQAARVLPILLERQKLERDSSRLLRATSGEGTTETLLRPAGVDSAANKNLLLHTVQDE